MIHGFQGNIPVCFPEVYPKYNVDKLQDHDSDTVLHVYSSQITSQSWGSARKMTACLHYHS